MGPDNTGNIYSIMPIPAPSDSLNSLLQQRFLWRGSEHEHRAATPSGLLPGHSTGFAALDASLPWKGWPPHGLVEIITPLWGAGELQLLLPLLRRLSTQGSSALWISPPCIPYAPALASAGVDIGRMILVNPPLKDFLWTVERALQTPASTLVLAWPAHVTGKHLRRLQLATVTGHTLGIVFHQRQLRHSASVLRLRAEVSGDNLLLTVLKARGSHQHGCILVPRRLT